jgi:hypothetical protein
VWKALVVELAQELVQVRREAEQAWERAQRVVVEDLEEVSVWLDVPGL